MVVQRTGWGKSLVYFIATALLRQEGYGPSLLISPLIALMRNQIEAAAKYRLRACAIHSGNMEEWDEIQILLRSNQVDLLMVSPEKLANHRFQDEYLLPIANRIGLMIVDEAHCISDWGHDFRPDYGRIVRVLQALPRTVPVLATTATANNRVIEDVMAQLGETLKIIRGPLVRESLKLQNIHLPKKAARLAWIAERLPQLSGSGIIYTLTVRDARMLSDWLKTQGIRECPTIMRLSRG